jgi:predicted RND superfamily exporter protein
MAATNEVVKDKELATILWVYAVIVVLVLVSYRSASGLLAICIPLFMVSIFANALMALFGIGLKVATLPVITLAVGIGVDYGIYIYDLIRHHVKVEGLPLREAYFRTLQKTGKAVIFTGLCLAGGVATWLFSDLQFQRDMGRLLVFMFTANMLGAVLLCPAYCRFLMRPARERIRTSV